MVEIGKRLGDNDMRALAARIRATKYESDGFTYGLSCDELNFHPVGGIFLKVCGNGVECVVSIDPDDNTIYANGGLPPIEGVEIIPFTETERFKNRHFVLKV